MTIQSMTGYAAVSRSATGLCLQLELKSVNGRFLDLSFRLDEELRGIEVALRERLVQAIGRGKVECRLALQPEPGTHGEPTPDLTVIEQLGRLERIIREQLPQSAPLSVAEILRWPGVLTEQTIDTARLHEEALALLEDGLRDFLASRAREGERLVRIMRERIANMRALVARVRPLLPVSLANYQARLTARLREAIGSNDEERIRQEVGLFATRIDVDEELSRLGAHLDEVERVLDAGGAVGKRLDFLLQELNREANTLAAKSVSSEITAIALELKLLIEQLREQVQNLE